MKRWIWLSCLLSIIIIVLLISNNLAISYYPKLVIRHHPSINAVFQAYGKVCRFDLRKGDEAEYAELIEERFDSVMIERLLKYFPSANIDDRLISCVIFNNYSSFYGYESEVNSVLINELDKIDIKDESTENVNYLVELSQLGEKLGEPFLDSLLVERRVNKLGTDVVAAFIVHHKSIPDRHDYIIEQFLADKNPLTVRLAMTLVFKCYERRPDFVGIIEKLVDSDDGEISEGAIISLELIEEMRRESIENASP